VISAETNSTPSGKLLYIYTDPAFDFTVPTGATTHILETIEAFETLGYEVTRLFAADSTPQQVKRVGRKYLPSKLRLLLRDISYIRTSNAQMKTARDLAERWRPDFIYERLGKFQTVGASLAKRQNIPLVVEYNASLRELEQFYGVGLRRAAASREREMLDTAEFIVVVSNALKRELAGMGFSGPKILVLPNAVTPEKLLRSADPDAVRDACDLHGKLTVGFMGNFAGWHGIDNLLSLIQILSAGEAGVRFLVVGGVEGNPIYDRFCRRIADEGLLQWAALCGSIPHEQVGSYLAAMDVAIIPDATEYGSPVKTFEYMAAGKPVIAPRVGPLEEVLSDRVTGFLFERHNVDELVELTMELLGDQALRDRVGKQAREYVLEHHTWAGNARRVLEALGFRHSGREPIH
jgi:glycosyltransferase involved in cell wall biosynthesis